MRKEHIEALERLQKRDSIWSEAHQDYIFYVNELDEDLSLIIDLVKKYIPRPIEEAPKDKVILASAASAFDYPEDDYVELENGKKVKWKKVKWKKVKWKKVKKT